MSEKSNDTSPGDIPGAVDATGSVPSSSPIVNAANSGGVFAASPAKRTTPAPPPSAPDSGASAPAATAPAPGAAATAPANTAPAFNAQPSAATNAVLSSSSGNAQTSANAGSFVPNRFADIPPEKLRRSKRVKRILIAIIIVLILALLAIAALAAYVFITQQQSINTIQLQDILTDNQNASDRLQDTGTTEEKPMPPLAPMFGTTTDEVLSQLGSDYRLVKTEEIADEELPQARQLATLTYVQDTKSSVGNVQAQSIYLSLNEVGEVIEVYFVSSLDLLGYPMSSFANLISNKTVVDQLLQSAGVAASADFQFIAPEHDQYTKYVDPLASNKRLTEESAKFSGLLAAKDTDATAEETAESAPTQFVLTLTYDYGAAGVADTPDRHPTQRMVYLRLR
ncbi:MAG: hypothetical protein LBU07_03720 [Coriobacteriales bacterium]|nr:hypothetical protein [Coriobacteriales bacterium]